MIYVTNEIRAKIWGIDRKEKYTDIKLSTSEKGANGYVYSHWFARAIGQAHEALKNCSEHEMVSITKSKLTNEGYTSSDGQGKSKFRWVIFEVAKIDSKESNETVQAKSEPKKETKKAATKSQPSNENADPWTDELPF